MIKFDPLKIANELDEKCLPRENMINMGVDTWNRALKVLKILADRNTSLWPYIQIYNSSRRYVNNICKNNDPFMSLEEKILAYEEYASKIMNNPNKW